MNCLLRCLLIAIILFAAPSNVEAQGLNKALDKLLTKKKQNAEEKTVNKPTKIKVPPRYRHQKEAFIAARQLRETQGITSEIHQKYVGKIVFSNKPITLQKEVESEFISHYTLGDQLYFQAYFDNSLTNYLLAEEALKKEKEIARRGSFRLQLYLNDKIIHAEGISEANEQERNTWTALTGAFIPDIEHEKSYYWVQKRAFNKFLLKEQANLKPDTYTVKAEIIPYSNLQVEPAYHPTAVMASGTFSLIVEETFSNKKHICFPLPAQENKTWEAGMLEAFKDLGRKASPKKVIIRSEDWHSFYQNGELIGRYLVATVVSTSGEDKCYTSEFDFMQDYDGSNYSNSFRIIALGSGRSDILCSCLEE